MAAALDNSAQDDPWSLSPSACAVIDRLLSLAASERRRLRLERALWLYEGAACLLSDPRSEAQGRPASPPPERKVPVADPASLMHTALASLLEALERSQALEHDLSATADAAAEAFAAAARSLRDRREVVWREGGAPPAVRLPPIAGASIGIHMKGGGGGHGGEGSSSDREGESGRGGGGGETGGDGEDSSLDGGGGEGRTPSLNPPSRESLALESWVGAAGCCRLLGRTQRYAELIAHLRGLVLPPPVVAGKQGLAAAAAASVPHAGAATVALLCLLDELLSGLSRLAEGQAAPQGTPTHVRPSELALHCHALVGALSHSLPSCWRALSEWDGLASRAAVLRSHRLRRTTEEGRAIPVLGRPSPTVLAHLERVIPAGGGEEGKPAAAAPGVNTALAARRIPGQATRPASHETRPTSRVGGGSSNLAARRAVPLSGGGVAEPAPSKDCAVGEALILAGIRLLAFGRAEEASAAFDCLHAWAAPRGWEWALMQEPARAVPERGVAEPPKGSFEPVRGLSEVPLAIARWCEGGAALGDEEDFAGRVMREEAFGALHRADARLQESLDIPPRLAADRDLLARETTALLLAQLQARWRMSILLESVGEHRAAASALQLSFTRVPLRPAHATLCRAVPKLRRAAASAQMRRAELLLLVATRARGSVGGSAAAATAWRGVSTREREREEGKGGEEGEEGAGMPGGVEESAAMEALEGVTDLIGDRDGRRALDMLTELHARHGDMGEAAATVDRAGDNPSLLMGHLLALQSKEREAAQVYRHAAIVLGEQGLPSGRAWLGRSMSRARMAAALLHTTAAAPNQTHKGKQAIFATAKPVSSAAAKHVTSAAAQLASRQAEEALVEAQEAARRALASEAECPGSLDSRQLWYARQVYGTLAARNGRKAEAAAALRAAAGVGETLMPRGGKVAAYHGLANALSDTDVKAAVAASDEAVRWLQGRGVATGLSLGGGRKPERVAGREDGGATADGEAWGELIPLVLYQRALLLGRVGRTPDAEAALRLTLFNHDTSHLPARLALSSLLATGGKLEQADAPLREALETAPEGGLPPTAAASLLEARARLWLHFHGAEVAKSRLAGGGPTAAQAARLDSLADELRLVLLSRPGSSAARAALGWVRWLGGDDKAAADELNRATGADPTDPLPQLYRAFITGAAISAGGEGLGDEERECSANVGTVRQAAQPFRDAAAQLLRSLPAHAQAAPPELWAQIRGSGQRSRTRGEDAGREPAPPAVSEGDTERVIMLGNCVRQLAAAAEVCAAETGRSGANAALPLYGYALDILAPLAAAHGAAAIEAASVQLARARLLWAAVDTASATSDLESASAALDSLSAHAGAAPSLRRMAAAAWCNMGVAREAAAGKARRAAAADAETMAALGGGRLAVTHGRRGSVAPGRRRGNTEGAGLMPQGHSRSNTEGQGLAARAQGEVGGGLELLLGPVAAGGGGVTGESAGKYPDGAHALASAAHVAETAQAADQGEENETPALRLEAEAEACYLRALARWPDHRRSLANLGALLVAAGRPREAVVKLNAAIAAGGSAEAGCAGQARKGSGDGGGEGDTEALGGGLIEAAARNNRAVASFDLGDVAAASRDLSAAAPAHRTARLNLARVAVAAGEWHKARDTLTSIHDQAWRRHALLRLRREEKATAQPAPRSAQQRPAEWAAASARGDAESEAAESEMAVLQSMRGPVDAWCACLDAGVADFAAAARLLFRPAGGAHPSADRRFTPRASASPPLTPWQLDVVCGLLGRPVPERSDVCGEAGGSDDEEGDTSPEPLPPPAPLPPGVKIDLLRGALDLQTAGDSAGAESLLCLGDPLRSLRAGRRSEVEAALLLVWSARSRRDAACEASIDELHAASVILARAGRPQLAGREGSFSAVEAEEVLQVPPGSGAVAVPQPRAGAVPATPVSPDANILPFNPARGGRLSGGKVDSLAAALHVEVGMRLEEACQTDAALHQYTEASTRWPSHRPALANAARLLAAEGQPIKAMERYLAMWERATVADTDLKGAADRVATACTAGIYSELCSYLELLRNGPSLRLEERLRRQQVRVALAVERWRSLDLSRRGRTRAGHFESRLASEACALLMERAAADPARLFGALGEPMWRETGVEEAVQMLRGTLGREGM